MAEVITTPERSPSRQAAMITAAQKQALMDNLQLEITERARKLRAQYALHAQGLRSRLEMRVNRIPQPLRTTNILDLINRYAEQADEPKAVPVAALKTATAPISKRASPVRQQALHSQSNLAAPRGVKRSSNEVSDKENVSIHEDLPQPKKRTKIATATVPSNMASRVERGVSRKVDASKVLSPKSHNSRTLPRSPIKGQPSSSSTGLAASSPQKSQLARPTSPLKPGPSVSAATAALAGMVESKSTRAGNNSNTTTTTTSRPGTAASSASSASTSSSLRGKRGAAAAAAVASATARTGMAPPPVPAKSTRGRAASSSSATSNTSSGTTVIKKKKTAPAPRAGAGTAAAAAAKKGIVSKVAGMAAAATGSKKAAAPAAPKKTAPAPTAGRALRSRK